jgi:hypothetical protein
MAKHRTLFRLVDEDRHFQPDLSPMHIVIITNLHDYPPDINIIIK